MKHICHITTVHPERDTRIFYKECKSLASNGNKVTLLVVNGDSFEEDGVQVTSLPCKFKGRIQRFRKASKTAFKKALEINADIYHFHDPEFLVAASKLVKRGSKVIYDVHEDLPRQLLSKHYIPKYLRKPVSVFVEKLENRYARQMTGIVTATDFIRDRFLQFHNKVESIKNYPILPAISNESKLKANKNAEIVYVGSITNERGLTELIKALELTKTDIRLNLAGKYAPEEYRNELVKLGGWGKVNEIGFANRVKVRELFQKSFAGMVTLHPIINYLDALPVKMFEYMADKLPVIASDFHLWKEIVEGNNCGICVNPMDPEAIANAINWIYEHPDGAEEMGQNGLKAVHEIYNWAIEEKKLINFYNNLLNN